MKKAFEIFQKNMMLVLVIIIAIVSVSLAYHEIKRDNTVQIVFLDVGQGDAIFITSPNGRQVLIDSGKYPDISEKISHYMPMSDRSLDMVIATHPDIDHIAGFNTLLEEYQIDKFIHSGLLAGAPIYRNIAKKVREHGISAHSALAGEKIFIDKNMYLEILSPYKNQKIENPNDYSVVVRLVYKNHSILLTGDASKSVEQNLIKMYGADILDSDILKLGHHGSKISSDENFIKTVNPKYGIISVGCDNQFGHPHANVLRVLDDQEIEEINTCEHGDIIFHFLNNEWILEK